jgi:hypothetical protein
VNRDHAAHCQDVDAHECAEGRDVARGVIRAEGLRADEGACADWTRQLKQKIKEKIIIMQKYGNERRSTHRT